MQVSSEQIEAFSRDGAVCVRGVASADEVALVEAGIERVLDEPSSLSMVASKPGDGLFVEDFCNWQRITEFEQFITTSNVAVIAGSLMQNGKNKSYEIARYKSLPANRPPPERMVARAGKILFPYPKRSLRAAGRCWDIAVGMQVAAVGVRNNKAIRRVNNAELTVW